MLKPRAIRNKRGLLGLDRTARRLIEVLSAQHRIITMVVATILVGLGVVLLFSLPLNLKPVNVFEYRKAASNFSDSRTNRAMVESVKDLKNIETDSSTGAVLLMPSETVVE